MGVKVTVADKWFSKCVRIRANWNCEYCRTNFEHDKGMLHCSHFISRGSLATRYHPLNAFAHCQTCHEQLGGGRWGGGNIAEFAEHYDQVFGASNRELIRRLSKGLFRKHKHHIKDISDHYRPIFQQIEKIRAKGDRSRIDFKMYNGAPELTAYEQEIRKELAFK